ncbi:MAG: hypothetical protein J0I18_23935 [Actinobacteria bacterium]|nr:hypothetical protein [Actinomycetota bacterium]
MNIVLPNLIIGPIVVIVGILVFIFRRQLRDMTVNAEKTAFGEKPGRALGQLQTPFWAGVAGIGGVAIGILMIIGGIVTLVSLNK